MCGIETEKGKRKKKKKNDEPTYDDFKNESREPGIEIDSDIPLDELEGPYT